jgi:hypothetical protein
MSYNYPGFTLVHPFPEPRPKETYGYHGGADYAAAAGTPVPVQYGGTVFRSGFIHGYGMAVIVETKTATGSFYTLYGHLGPNGLPKVAKDGEPPTQIKPGQTIGEVASRAYNETFGLHYNPHLHLEIIDGRLQLNPVGPLGVMSSDLTFRANPETFDINNPNFPYEITGRPPKPGAAAVSDGKNATPPSSAISTRSPTASNIQPASLPQTRLPGGNPPAGAPLQLHPGMPIPDAEEPSSVGGPNGPSPLVPAKPAPQLLPGGGLPDATGHGLYYDEPTPIPNGFPYVLPGAGQSAAPPSNISVDAQIGNEGLDGTTASPGQTPTLQAWAAGKMGATVAPPSAPSPGAAPQPPVAPASAIPPQPAPIFAPQPAVAPAPPPPAFAQIPAMQALPIFAPPRKPIDLSVLGTMLVNRAPIFPGQG